MTLKSSLVRQPETIDLLGEEVQYIKPGLIYLGNVLRFYKSSLAPMLFSRAEIEVMSDNELLSACVDKANAKDSPKDIEQMVGQMFLGEAMHTEIIPLLRNSFPDLDPYMVTDLCFNTMFETVLQDVFDLLDPTPKT